MSNYALIVALALWWLLFPSSYIRAMLWASRGYGRARVTPQAIRVAGFVLLLVAIATMLFGQGCYEQVFV